MGRPERAKIRRQFIESARRAHQDAKDSVEHARIHRSRRDVFIRRLYATGDFTYPQLAKELGCGPDLIAKIVQGRTASVRRERK